MSYGPFQTKEGGETISRFAKFDLLPVVHDIEKLAIDVSAFRLGFWGALAQNDLSKIERRFGEISKRFLEVYHVWNTPDLLFKDVKHETGSRESMVVMADYFNVRNAVIPHFESGFRLLEYIQSIITVQNTAANNRVSIFLSLAAVALSVFLGIIV